MRNKSLLIALLFGGLTLTSCMTDDAVWVTTVEPTCISPGLQERQVMGRTVETREIEPTGHNWTLPVVNMQPTHVNVGAKSSECMNCGAVKEYEIAATGHTKIVNNGFDNLSHWDICECGDVTNKEDHKFGAPVEETVQDSQSQHAGLKYLVYTCECGYQNRVPQAQEGHSIDLNTFAHSSTQHWNTCECGERLNVSNHSYTSKVVIPATSTTEGLRTYTCSVCNYQYDEVIKATGGSDSGQLNDYYQAAAYKQGAELKLALRSIISKKKHNTSYDDLKSILQKSDEDPHNSSNLILFYSQVSIKKTSDMNVWNREHVWPNSKGVGKTGPGSDPHHLRPADPKVNSSRGNYKVKDLNHQGTQLYYQGTIATGCYVSGSYFEPRDEIKGDVARIYLYLLTCYDNLDGSFSSVCDLATCVKWNAQDPVSEMEILRNEAIYNYQGNRNPYIDHPEFVNLIFA